MAVLEQYDVSRSAVHSRHRFVLKRPNADAIDFRCSVGWCCLDHIDTAQVAIADQYPHEAAQPLMH
jgi:hypothetical protein